MRLGGQGWHLRSQRRGQSTDTQDTTTDRTNSVVFLGSSGISGKHGLRCKEGYDPWIVRLGPAEESDTLMKARTRRTRQDKTSLLVIRALPVVSGFVRVFVSLALCPSRLPHNRWSAFVGLSTLRFPEIPEEPKIEMRIADGGCYQSPSPNASTVCRSGSKYARDTSATDSGVIASIRARTSSSERNGSSYSATPAARYIRDDGLSSDRVTWPLSWLFPSAISPGVRLSAARRASSSRIAARASTAVSGAVPT